VDDMYRARVPRAPTLPSHVSVCKSVWLRSPPPVGTANGDLM
jgi:hypothetical protein